MKKQSSVRLSKQEHQELRRLLQSGLQPVRTVLRALALQQLADGQPMRQVAENVALTPKTVWLTSRRYRQGGLERALYERPRPGKARGRNVSSPDAPRHPILKKAKAEYAELEQFFSGASQLTMPWLRSHAASSSWRCCLMLATIRSVLAQDSARRFWLRRPNQENPER